jgi:hypothetical protein
MALVVNQRHYQGQWLAVTTPEGMTEAGIKLGFEAFPAQIQNYLGRVGLHGVPLPSDLHSKIHHCAAGAGNYRLVGTPDFVLLNNTTNRVTALVEVKTPSSRAGKVTRSASLVDDTDCSSSFERELVELVVVPAEGWFRLVGLAPQCLRVRWGDRLELFGPKELDCSNPSRGIKGRFEALGWMESRCD